MAEPVIAFERLYSEGRYYDALVALLPKGSYWDAQLADTKSDLVRELKLQAASFKAENDLLANTLREGFPWRAQHTLADWEELAQLPRSEQRSIAERQHELRLWRAGRLPDFASLAVIVDTYGYRLTRIRFPLRAFGMASTVADVFFDGRANNVVQFLISANGKKVRPAHASGAYTMRSTMSDALFLPFSWQAYFPLVAERLAGELAAFLPIYKLVELRFGSDV